MYAKWTLAPSGNYIGVIEFNNRHYYSYGRTADHLERNIKVHMYQKERISASQIHLEQNMSDQIDMRYACQKFISTYVKPKINRRPIMINKVLMAAPTPMEEQPEKEPKKMVQNNEKEYVTEIDKDTNEMVVYELKEVARYKLKKNEQ